MLIISSCGSRFENLDLYINRRWNTKMLTSISKYWLTILLRLILAWCTAFIIQVPKAFYCLPLKYSCKVWRTFQSNKRMYRRRTAVTAKTNEVFFVILEWAFGRDENASEGKKTNSFYFCSSFISDLKFCPS